MAAGMVLWFWYPKQHLFWYGFIHSEYPRWQLQGMPNGTCFDMLWSNYAAYAKWQVVWFYLFKFQPMPCGTCFFSFTKCQMALVAMVFYTPCFFPFSLCQLSNNVHILSVYNQVLHDKSCVWFGKKGALIHHYRASWILELFGWKWFLEEFWLKGIKLSQIPINLWCSVLPHA